MWIGNGRGQRTLISIPFSWLSASRPFSFPLDLFPILSLSTPLLHLTFPLLCVFVALLPHSWTLAHNNEKLKQSFTARIWSTGLLSSRALAFYTLSSRCNAYPCMRIHCGDRCSAETAECVQSIPTRNPTATNRKLFAQLIIAHINNIDYTHRVAFVGQCKASKNDAAISWPRLCCSSFVRRIHCAAIFFLHNFISSTRYTRGCGLLAQQKEVQIRAHFLRQGTFHAIV